MFGLFEKGLEPEISRLDAGHGDLCAVLHTASFAFPWPQSDLESLLLATTTVAHGAFGPKPTDMLGFVLSRRAADEAEILTIAVAPRQRGKGLAARLLRANSEALMALGAKSLFLEVEGDNKPARALYDRAGFKSVGERKSYYRKTDGTTSLAYIMRRPLGP